MSFLGNHFGNDKQTLKLAVQHFCLLFKGFNNFFLNYDMQLWPEILVKPSNGQYTEN